MSEATVLVSASVVLGVTGIFLIWQSARKSLASTGRRPGRYSRSGGDDAISGYWVDTSSHSPGDVGGGGDCGSGSDGGGCDGGGGGD